MRTDQQGDKEIVQTNKTERRTDRKTYLPTVLGKSKIHTFHLGCKWVCNNMSCRYDDEDDDDHDENDDHNIYDYHDDSDKKPKCSHQILP